MKKNTSLGSGLKDLINETMCIRDFAYQTGYPLSIVMDWCLDERCLQDKDKVKIAQVLGMSKAELEKRLKK